MPVHRIGIHKRLSSAVIYDKIVYLAGQVAEGSTVTEQCNSIFAQIDNLLMECGTKKSNLLQAIIYLADIADFDEMNHAWELWIDRQSPPARAASEAKLAWPNYRVEFIVTAAIP